MSGQDIDASDWTERDLLTRELAAERLAAEEAETIANLDALRGAPNADSDEIELLERRLRAIEASRANVATSQQSDPGNDESRSRL